MLIYSKMRIYPASTNIIILENDEAFFYVHRTLYDQAVILYDLYKDDINRLCQEVYGSHARPDVLKFNLEMPEPISILGCFLGLVPDEFEDIKSMCGAIHVMSGPLNFRGMIKLPKDARNAIKFGNSIRDEYETSWDAWLQQNTQYTPPGYEQDDSVEEQSGPTQHIEITDDNIGDIMANLDMDAFLAAWEADTIENPLSEEFGRKPDSEEESTSEPALVETPVVAEQPVIQPAPVPTSALEPQPEPAQDGLSFLKQMSVGGL